MEPVFAFVTQRDVQKDNNTKETSTSEKSSQIKIEEDGPRSDEPAVGDVEKNERNPEQQSLSSIDENSSDSTRAESNDEGNTDQLRVLDNENLQTQQVLETSVREEERNEAVTVNNDGSTIVEGVNATPYEEKNVQILCENKEVLTANAQSEPIDENESIKESTEGTGNEVTSITDTLTPKVGDEPKESVPMESEKNVGSAEILLHDFHTLNSVVPEDEKDSLKAQIKMLEDALQGAAHQSKVINKPYISI